MKRQTGFSLVELMIAITLGLMLSGAAISAFISVKRVSSTTSAVAALADSGRFAFDQMGTATRSAGYMGCSTSVDARVDLSLALPILVTDLAEPLGGYEYTGVTAGAYTLKPPYIAATSATKWSTSAALGGKLDALILNASVSGSAIGHPIAGSDVLVTHGAPVGIAPLYLTGPASVGAGSLTTNLATSSTTGGFAAVFAAGGVPIAAVANCQSAEVFSLGALSGATFALSNANAQQHLITGYGAGSHFSLIGTRVYYVGVGSDGEGALFVLDTQGGSSFATPVELVPDVENMQLLYGVDTTGSQTVGAYVTADQVSVIGTTQDFNSVIDVKIALLLVGAPGSGSSAPVAATYSLLGTTITVPIDNKMRSVFTTTFTLRNQAG